MLLFFMLMIPAQRLHLAAASLHVAPAAAPTFGLVEKEPAAGRAGADAGPEISLEQEFFSKEEEAP